MPTKVQADVIRKALGIRKRREDRSETVETLIARGSKSRLSEAEGASSWT
jgi:hypothetical protein